MDWHDEDRHPWIPAPSTPQQKKKSEPIDSPLAHKGGAGRTSQQEAIDDLSLELFGVTTYFEDLGIEEDLVSNMRQHQREGVEFLHHCVMGRRSSQQRCKGFGCILADGMGVGKTLQAVIVIWVLLRKAENSGAGVCSKVLVLCPSSLVDNWAAEFHRWLGDRCRVCLATAASGGCANAYRRFAMSDSPEVLLSSYDTFLRESGTVRNKVDFVVCDEAHRLKNKFSAITKSVASMCKRRLLITGTPLQNDIQEFYTLMNLANEGILGAPGKVGSSDWDVKGIASEVVIRRSSSLNSSRLPPKRITNVYVSLTTRQQHLYTEELGRLKCESLSPQSSVLSTLASGVPANMAKAMRALGNLTRIVNLGSTPNASRDVKDASAGVPGKMLFLLSFLRALKQTGSSEKVVIVSNSTLVLDMYDKLHSWRTYRLDGKTPTSARSRIVAEFNRCSAASLLFLSSKAGGVGLNIYGANHLVMYDPDWNPAHDAQSMARIWREGQKKTCQIIRLLSTGTLEETIYRRQLRKGQLSAEVSTESTENRDPAGSLPDSFGCARFRPDDFNELFQSPEGFLSSTHDAMCCRRCNKGIGCLQADTPVEGDLSTWSHHPVWKGLPTEELILAASRMRLEGHGSQITFAMSCFFAPPCEAREEPAPPAMISCIPCAPQDCASARKVAPAIRKRKTCFPEDAVIPPEVGVTLHQRRIRTRFCDDDGNDTPREEKAVSRQEPSSPQSPKSKPVSFRSSDFTRWATSAISPYHKHRLMKCWQGRTLRFLTICSGTEVAKLLVEHLATALLGIGVDNFGTQHVGACESQSWKQTWILENFPDVPVLYTDAKDLANEKAYCCVARGAIDVVDSDIVFAGVSCRSVSNFNVMRKTFSAELAQGNFEQGGCTGETFLAVLSYLERHLSTRYVILENVVGLLRPTIYGRPIDAFLKALENVGFTMSFEVLDAKNFHLPQSRRRVYIFGSRNTVAHDIIRETLSSLQSTHTYAQGDLSILENIRTTPAPLYPSPPSKFPKRRLTRRSCLWKRRHREYIQKHNIAKEFGNVELAASSTQFEHEKHAQTVSVEFMFVATIVGCL